MNRMKTNSRCSRCLRQIGPAIRFRAALAVCLLLSSGHASLADERRSASEILDQRIREASRGGYRSPPAPELHAAEALFVRSLQAAEPFEVLREAWAKLDFQLEQLDDQDPEIWLLHESPQRQTGRGFYAFRPGSPVPVALQAPHSFADLHTRRLTAVLFHDGRFASAAWNTVHRREADVAHLEHCYLNAYTRACLQVWGAQAVICQLHGFSRGKRQTAAGRASDVIASNGTRSSDYQLFRTARQLRSHWPDFAVRLYPDEVSELGGTTNQQGHAVRASGQGRFLHLEMSAELRRELAATRPRRTDWPEALQCGLRGNCEECAEQKGSNAYSDNADCAPWHDFADHIVYGCDVAQSTKQH